MGALVTDPMSEPCPACGAAEHEACECSWPEYEEAVIARAQAARPDRERLRAAFAAGVIAAVGRTRVDIAEAFEEWMRKP